MKRWNTARRSEAEKSKKLTRRPWQYFNDHFYCTYRLETGFPHPTSLYPGVQDHLVKTLGGYDYDVRRKVLQSNAAKLYNLPF